MEYKKRTEPECETHPDCFANKRGKCIALRDNDFKGKDCPLYKPREEKKK